MESLTYVRCLTSYKQYKQRHSSSMLESLVRAVFSCAVAKVHKVYSKCNRNLLSDYDGDLHNPISKISHLSLMIILINVFGIG